MTETIFRDSTGRPYTVLNGVSVWVEEPVYHDSEGRAYTTRDGASVWIDYDISARAAESWSARPVVRYEPAIEYISFWPRVGARLIDLVVIYALAMVVGFAIGMGVGIRAGLNGTAPGPDLARMGETTFAGVVSSILAGVAYYAVAEGLHGSTVGKKVLGFTVRQEDGSPCRMPAALGREFAYFIDGLFFGIIAYFAIQSEPTRQRLGDQWAKTVVVRAATLPSEQRKTHLGFAAAITLACLANGVVLAAGFLVNLA